MWRRFPHPTLHRAGCAAVVVEGIVKGKREDTYSVRLPAGFPHVSSSVVREMLTVLFAQKIPLVDDPGSGEEYLRLTLPRAQVHALQALAGGDSAEIGRASCRERV